MADNGNGNGNGNGLGNSAAALARLTERSIRQQERLDASEHRVDALEALVAERASWRGLVAPVGLVVAGLFSFYIFGIEPVKDSIAAETTERMEEDAQIRSGFKYGIQINETSKLKLLDERDLRYTQSIEQNEELSKSNDRRLQKLREEFNKSR